MTKIITNKQHQALKQEYSTELLERTRAGQSRQLSEFLDNHLKGNATVLLEEKIGQLEQRLERDVSVISCFGGVKRAIQEYSSLGPESGPISRLQAKCKILNNHLDYQRMVFEELDLITQQTIHRKYTVVEATLWNQYYQELSAAKQSEPAFDDTFLDEEEDEDDQFEIVEELKLEEEIQEMLKMTYTSIKNVEELQLKNEMERISSVLQEKLDVYIADVDKELELVFKHIDSVSQSSLDASARNAEAVEIISQIERINIDLDTLSEQLEGGLIEMEKWPLSDRCKSFLDTSDPQIRELMNIFDMPEDSSLLHKDKFLFAAREWLLNIKRRSAAEVELIEGYSNIAHSQKSFIDASIKSLYRFSAPGQEFQESPDFISEKEDKISQKVFSDFYPALRKY